MEEIAKHQIIKGVSGLDSQVRVRTDSESVVKRPSAKDKAQSAIQTHLQHSGLLSVFQFLFHSEKKKTRVCC